ncbi:MAG TPA: hypothetical protein DIW24_05775 [Bacteroidetes bacterium]|nr:hypothetical protein [Bacteroidota bacterium]HRR07779.1 T9SS type A sorting domain-containing protein [Rhodothermales bacterium]
MRKILFFVLFVPIKLLFAQNPPDIVQSYGGPAAAFAWPIPFAHIPQTFTKHAVRFTAPFSGGLNSRMASLDLRVWGTTKSQDGYNDSLVVRFLSTTPDGTPDETKAFQKPLKVVLSSLKRGDYNTLGLGVKNLIFKPNTHVWVSFELEAVGKKDTLVMVSDNAEIPALGRSAAYIQGLGWQMMRETQFNNEYIFQVAVKWSATSVVDREKEQVPIEMPLVEVYPNPFDVNPTLRFYHFNPEVVYITVFDLMGKKIIDQVLPISNEEHHLILPDELPSGLYLLRIQHREAIIIKRLIRAKK